MKYNVAQRGELPPAPVLVTGAGGCIGAWVLRQLAAAKVAAIGFDLTDDRRRLALLAGDEVAQAQPWETGDIADSARVMEAARKHEVTSIIHLAALQVPYCKADPIAGARANVLGTVSILEVARHMNIRHLAYASSNSALAMGEDSPWDQTIYGAYKVCNEQVARVYHRDWQVPSIGIRPNIVYGAMRDRGMSSVLTVAILAAAIGKKFRVPFCGPIGFVYTEEVALAFNHAAACSHDGSPVFDLNGAEATVEHLLELISAKRPQAEVTCSSEKLELPAFMSDKPLEDYVGSFRRWSLEEGLDETLVVFDRLITAAKLSAADVPD